MVQAGYRLENVQPIQLRSHMNTITAKDGTQIYYKQLVAGFLKSETEILTNKVQWSIQRGNKIRFELIP